MTIETRFNRNDVVWFIQNNKATNGVITDIEVKIDEKIKIKYTVKTPESEFSWAFPEEPYVYLTKEELINNL